MFDPNDYKGINNAVVGALLIAGRLLIAFFKSGITHGWGYPIIGFIVGCILMGTKMPSLLSFLLFVGLMVISIRQMNKVMRRNKGNKERLKSGEDDIPDFMRHR